MISFIFQFQPKTEVHVENGVRNHGFNESDEGPVHSPADTPNTTIEHTPVPKTICSPPSSEDNHPDALNNTTIAPGFKFKYQ